MLLALKEFAIMTDTLPADLRSEHRIQLHSGQSPLQLNGGLVESEHSKPDAYFRGAVLTEEYLIKA